MNTIQNYGMMSYQTTFCGKRKAVKTLSDIVTQEQIKAKLNNLPKLTCTCPCPKESSSIEEGVIGIIKF